MGGRAFIVTQSIKKLSDTLQAAVFNDYDYKLLSDDARISVRFMKTNFNARPIFHRKRTRIIAHFLICYTALLVYRLLEVRLDRYGEHFTTDEILKTLRSMSVMNVQDIHISGYLSSIARFLIIRYNDCAIIIHRV